MKLLLYILYGFESMPFKTVSHLGHDNRTAGLNWRQMDTFV